jgi:hypothetical protein
MFFSNAEQANVRRENPDFRMGETAKELGKMWAEASTEARSKYVEMASKDKERYEKEKHEYHTSGRAAERSSEMSGGHRPSYNNGPSYSQQPHVPQPPRHVEITSPSRMIGPANLAF